MISPLDRRKLLSTFNAQEIGQIRAALQRAGVEFTIKQDSHPVGGTGYGNVTSAITLGAGAAPFEYTVYVHKDDFALAEAAPFGAAAVSLSPVTTSTTAVQRRGTDGAPAGQALARAGASPGGLHQTGDHRSPLRMARRVVAPHGSVVPGKTGG